MALSLRRLILLTLLTLTCGGAVAVGAISYRAARQALETEAVHLTALVADSRRMSLLRTTTRERARVERFAQVASTRCNAMPEEERATCFARSAESLSIIEGAAAARLARPDAAPITVGNWHHNEAVPPGQLISIHREPDRTPSYVMEVTIGGITYSLELPIQSIQHIMADRTGLGEYGETFLIDADGLPLTPVLEPVAAQRVSAIEPRLTCLSGASGETLSPDYRGIDVIHGYRFMKEFGRACVMVNVGQKEAFLASTRLGQHLIVAIVLIALAGTALSVIIADRIGAPLRRLHDSARRLEAGDFDASVEPSGPSEVRDLTSAFRAMAASLRSSHESLAAANRLKDEFLATLSHELRTPLNAIVGWASLLRSTPSDTARIERGLTIIERNARLQVELVSELLDMSRIITGRLQLRTARVDLADVVRAAADTVRPAADAKGISLTVRAPGGATTMGDTVRLQQVVWNLLSNAVKFTPNGGAVTVDVTRHGAQNQIAVRDTGPGIAPAFLPHVFEPFRQADSTATRAHGGLGLGLAIARHLVELHGGRIRAENSGPQGGAAFVVDLPAAAAAPADEAAPDRVAAAGGADAGRRTALRNLRILVVEDNPDALELARTTLEQHGAEVRVAETAAEALAAFEARPPDVVVADIGLPGEDGYSLIQKIRALNVDGGQVPALALTAYARAEERARALAAGFTAHLAKPVAADTLVDSVANLVNAR